MTQQVGAFWDLFRERAAALAQAGSADADTPVCDELLQQLQRVNPGLYLEYSIDSAGNELIITADGNRELFPVAHALVAAAPTVRGWAVLALKPRIGFPKTVRWERFTLSMGSVVFDPLEREGSTDLGLRIFIPGIAPAEVDDAHNALLRAIDHGLGEEQHAEAVQHIEVCPLPEGATPDDFIELTKLEEFVTWRRDRQQGAG